MKKSQLDYFRRLARENKNEILAFLVGRVSDSLVVVHRFDYPVLLTQTACEVDPTLESQHAIEQTAIADHLTVVGTIHSHPEYIPVLSPTDYADHVRLDHSVSGVCSVFGRKTQCLFWTAESSLALKVEYT